jgi:hypothetical protein
LIHDGSVKFCISKMLPLGPESRRPKGIQLGYEDHR